MFLLSTPLFTYVLNVFGVIPPLHILNEKLVLGEHDSGMGGACSWKPFQLSNDDYIELVEHFLTNPDLVIIEDRELWSKQNFKKWHGALLSKHGRNAKNKH